MVYTFNYYEKLLYFITLLLVFKPVFKAYTSLNKLAKNIYRIRPWDKLTYK